MTCVTFKPKDAARCASHPEITCVSVVVVVALTYSSKLLIVFTKIEPQSSADEATTYSTRPEWHQREFPKKRRLHGHKIIIIF